MTLATRSDDAPKGWRSRLAQRAEELRAIAKGMTDAVARRGLPTGAASYDAMADRNEARADRADNTVVGKEMTGEPAEVQTGVVASRRRLDQAHA